MTSGTHVEGLITVLLIDANEVDADAIIRVTVDLDSDLLTTDNDIRVGISDGSYSNQFTIMDTSVNQVCHPNRGSHESNTASEGRSYYPGQVTMIFQPLYKYSLCYTGHDGGHVNVGKFTTTVNPSSWQLNQEA